jgi:predicted MFS family arabinose efflux permease
VTVLFIGAGLMGTFYLATLFMQQVLQYGPLRAGAAALPFGLGIVLASGIASKLVEKLSARTVAGPGLLLAAAGLWWLSTLQADASYWGHLAGPIFLTSAGLGLAFVPMTLTVVQGVDEREVGVASALMNTAQQIGAALGLAVLTTISTTAAGTRLPDALMALRSSDPDLVARAGEALTYGYTRAYLAAAMVLVVAAALTTLTITSSRRHRSAEAPAADQR